jgi:hypothetical protein
LEYDETEKLCYILNNEKSAKWYIDNRDNFKNVIKQYELPIEKEIRLNKESIMEINKEENNRIRRTDSDDFIKIKKEGNCIKAEYVKDDKFIEIIKILNFKWYSGEKGKFWFRNINVNFNGSFIDRIVELSTIMLKNDFNVELENSELKELILEGKYNDEVFKWIKYNDGDSSFVISTTINNENYYDIIKKNFKYAKYSAGQFSIAKSNYKTIIDFSAKYNFELSKRTHEIITEMTNFETNKIIIKDLTDKKSKVIENKIDNSLDFLKNE